MFRFEKKAKKYSTGFASECQENIYIHTSVKTEKNRSLSSNLPGFPRLQLASVKTESQFGVDYFSKKSSF